MTAPEEFLQSGEYVDWNSPTILSKARALANLSSNQFELVKNSFEFVRDDIEHSWDLFEKTRSDQLVVTARASDVLRYQTGYCYAKSHLLAALLRANNIPAALCYQRLRLDNQPQFCLHGLNAVYLEDVGWYRIDPRGNTENLSSEFSPPVENLALELFGLGEFHLDGLFVEPKECVVKLLESSLTVPEVFERLSETDEYSC